MSSTEASGGLGPGEAPDMSQASAIGTMPAAAGPRTTPRRRSMWRAVRDKLTKGGGAKIDVADAVVAIEACRDSAEDFSRLNALLCTAMAGFSFPRIALRFHDRNLVLGR